MTIAPKLGILVGVAMVGLCVAGVVAGYLMQQEMLSARIDQTKAIATIARNIQSVAAGSSEISSHIGGVTTAAEATGSAASEVLTNARELDNQSGMLRSAVDGFLAKVRAA